MLDNIDSLALTRVHADERRLQLQLQQLDRDLLIQTEDALLEHIPDHDEDIDTLDDDEDSIGTESAVKRVTRPNKTLWHTQATNSATRARIQTAYLHPDHISPLGIKTKSISSQQLSIFLVYQ